MLLAEQIATIDKRKVKKIGFISDRKLQKDIFKCFIYSAAYGDRDDDLREFGKHSSKTLSQIAEIDPGYIAWAKENMTREPVKSLLAQM